MDRVTLGGEDVLGPVEKVDLDPSVVSQGPSAAALRSGVRGVGCGSERILPVHKRTNAADSFARL